MGQCLSRKRQKDNTPKQDKNIDDKRMFKLGIDVLNRDFCIQIGYNRKAVKTYGQGDILNTPKGMTETVIPEEGSVCQTPPSKDVA